MDAKEGKEVKEGKEGKDMKDPTKEGKELESNRSVSVMSSLSYRKRSNLKDSIGGTGDESSLFSTLKDQSGTIDRSSLRKAKAKPGDDMDDRGSVISQAYSEAASRARKGLDRRWTSRSSPEFDKESSMSSRMSSGRGMDPDDDDDVKSSVSGYSVRRSSSWMDDGRSDSYVPSVSPTLSRRAGGGGSRSPGSVSRADSRISLARSSRLSEFGLRLDDDDDDDRLSMAFSEGGVSSVRSLGRSLSTPGRSPDDAAGDAGDVKSVSHRNYLDPDLEKAINEVLSFKPIKFKRRSMKDSEGEEEEDGEGGGGGATDEAGERKSSRGGLDTDEGLGRSTSSLRRSASGSALDYGRPSSSISSRSTSRHKAKKKGRDSESESSSEDERGHRRGSRRKGKKSSRKSSRKNELSSESSSSESSESSSSSCSTVSYRSSSSVKKGPARRIEEPQGEGADGAVPERPPSKKEEKKKKKKMDNLVMKYLYKPDSD